MIKRTLGDRLFDGANYAAMLIIFVIMVYPFLYIINYSLSDPALISGSALLLPQNPNIDAYVLAFSDSSIVNGIFISVARTISGSALMIFFTSMAGYVLTRDDLIAIRFFRRFFVLTMYFSSGIIPAYILMNELHLAGTFLVYIIPSAVAVFNLILIKTYIEGLPKSLEESALIDGANDFQLFFRIIFPISKPVIAAVVLFACIAQWNAFIDTQFYNAMNTDLYPLQYVLYNALQSISSIEQITIGRRVQHVTPESLKMAITVITVLPIMLVYPILQKYFIKGLLIGSIKG